MVERIDIENLQEEGFGYNLAVPSTFDESLSYEEQILLLNEIKQDKLVAGDNITLTRNANGTYTISSTGGGVSVLYALAEVTPSAGFSKAYILRNINTGEQSGAKIEIPIPLKGDKGDNGVGISRVEKTGTSGLIDTYTITYTDSTTSTFTVTNGQPGQPGQTPAITAYASINNNTGVPSVVVEKTGTDLAPILTFVFSNLKGAPGQPGDAGNGITSITKTSTAGLVDTYTITYTDGTTSTFDVTNGAPGTPGQPGSAGKGITSVTKTSTAGLVDTYTITYTDGTTSTFDVTNGAPGTPGQPGAAGKGITSITKTSTSGLVDTYTITYTDGTTSTFDVTNGAPGTPGQPGAAGVGVPTGGTAGQVLAKIDGTDYNTEWITPSGGGSSVSVSPSTSSGREIGSITVDNVPYTLYAGLANPDRYTVNIYTNETALGENMQVTDIGCYIPETAYDVPIQLNIWSANNEVIFMCDMGLNVLYYDTDIAIMPSNAVAKASYPVGEYIITIPQFTSTNGVWDTTNTISIKPLASGGLTVDEYRFADMMTPSPSFAQVMGIPYSGAPTIIANGGAIATKAHSRVSILELTLSGFKAAKLATNDSYNNNMLAIAFTANASISDYKQLVIVSQFFTAQQLFYSGVGPDHAIYITDIPVAIIDNTAATYLGLMTMTVAPDRNDSNNYELSYVIKTDMPITSGHSYVVRIDCFA